MLKQALWAMIRRDLRLAYRQRSQRYYPMMFFVMVVSLFPLAILPDPQLLHKIAPGIVWIAALLASLLGLEYLFRYDFDDGSLEQLLLTPIPLSVLMMAKVVVHWLVSSLPLIMIVPIFALLLNLSIQELFALLVSLLLGTPILSLLGAIMMALTVTLRNNGILLSLLILPLCIPILIFGAGSVMNVSVGLSAKGIYALLGAMLAITITFVPVIIAGALRIGLTND